MKYKKGYKYQLQDTEVVKTNILGYSVKTDWLRLEKDGTLYCLKGYAWDGPSGPTIDTKSFMRGSLFHDALYELMRKDKIPKSYKDVADVLLIQICLEDKMWKLRTKWVYWGIQKYGNNSLLKPKKVYEC